MSVSRAAAALVPMLASAVLLGCPTIPEPSAVGAEEIERTIRFTDVTETSGVGFRHRSAATPERYLPETMGAGVAIFDADGDDRPDLLFVDGLAVADLDTLSADPDAGTPDAGTPGAALYRNRGDGTFEDVSAASGLDAPWLGMGVGVGDFDGDGDLDVVLTGVGIDGVGGERLWRNRGDGTFEDVSAAMLPEPRDAAFGSSVAFVDVDRDGWLDLYVGRYVTWSPQTDRPCHPDGVHRSYCTPEAYPGASNRLYRNVEGRRFVDVTEDAGLFRPDGKTLGVVAMDFDGDLWPDLAVANDTVRNFFFRNRRDGTFEEVALEVGVALGQSGAPRGAMGIDAGDLDGDGRPDLVIGNFAQEMASVYLLGEGGVFLDESARVGVGLPTLMTLAFGVLADDLDGDGRLDLVFANGHIEPEIERFQPLQSYAQSPNLFRNRGAAAFEEPALAEDDAFARAWVGRGLASGDLDGDGDLDLVVTQNGGSARVLRNDSPTRPHLRLHLEGRESPRTPYGARVEIELADRTIYRWLTSARSYLSASDPTLVVGLGEGAEVRAVRVAWPSGHVQELGALEPGRLHRVVETVDEASGEPAG